MLHLVCTNDVLLVFQAMGTYKQTDDNNRYASALPSKYREYKDLLIVVKKQGRGVMYSFCRKVLCLSYNIKNDPHIWASLRGLAGSSIANVQILVG